MDKFTDEDLKKLIETKDTTCISLYMSTADSVKDPRKPAILLRNQIREISSALSRSGLSPIEINNIIKPAVDLTNDSDFWYSADRSLAFFMTPDFVKFYRLPLECKTELIVGNRFHIKPLLSLFTGNIVFYLLALSLKNVKLFKCDKYSIAQIPLKNLPASVEDAHKFEEAETGLRFHTISGIGANSQRTSVYHTQGNDFDYKNKMIIDFFHILEKAITDHLNKTNPPLILAGTEQIVSLYRQVNKYPHLLEEWTQGNSDIADMHIFHDKAYPIVENVVFEKYRKAFEQYHALVKERKASDKIDDIVLSSYEGKVRHLFADTSTEIWGKFNPENNEVKIHETKLEGDEDLIDLSVVYTIVNGGKVFTFAPDKITQGVPVAAVYRY